MSENLYLSLPFWNIRLIPEENLINVGVLFASDCLLCIREVMVKKYYYECKKSSVTAQNVLNFWDFLIENNPIKMFCECAFAMACTLLNIISFPPVTDCV